MIHWRQEIVSFVRDLHWHNELGIQELARKWQLVFLWGIVITKYFNMIQFESPNHPGRQDKLCLPLITFEETEARES